MYKLSFLRLPIFSKGYGNILKLDEHIEKRYGEGFELVNSSIIDGFVPLNMRDFEGKKHCVLTSMTAIMAYYRKNGIDLPDDKKLFRDIKKLASRRGLYIPFIGVNVFTIGLLSKLVWKYFGYKAYSKNKIFLKKKPSAARIIKEEINNGRPFFLSFAGGDYENHTTTCYGYEEFEREGKKLLFLLVNDNWSTGEKFVDLNMLASIKTSFFAISTTRPFK